MTARSEGGGRLFARVAGWPRAGMVALDLPAVPGRPARQARLAVRFGEVALAVPKNAPKAGRGPLSLRIVELCEPDPPAGVPPVCWRLLTTRPVTTMCEALEVAAQYRMRWRIEEVFRTMKRKGFDVEGMRIEAETPRNILIMVAFVAATIVMQMVAARDGTADGGGGLRPLTDAFDSDDRPLLDALSRRLEGRTARQKNPHPPDSLAFATWVCAQARRLDRILRQTWPGRHPARLDRIPDPQTRRKPRAKRNCVNLIARPSGSCRRHASGMTARAAAGKHALSHTSGGFCANVGSVATMFGMAATGGGWIVSHPVMEDRNQVRSTTVFA